MRDENAAFQVCSRRSSSPRILSQALCRLSRSAAPTPSFSCYFLKIHISLFIHYFPFSDLKICLFFFVVVWSAVEPWTMHWNSYFIYWDIEKYGVCLNPEKALSEDCPLPDPGDTGVERRPHSGNSCHSAITLQNCYHSGRQSPLRVINRVRREKKKPKRGATLVGFTDGSTSNKEKQQQMCCYGWKSGDRVQMKTPCRHRQNFNL